MLPYGYRPNKPKSIRIQPKLGTRVPFMVDEGKEIHLLKLFMTLENREKFFAHMETKEELPPGFYIALIDSAGDVTLDKIYYQELERYTK